MAISIISQKKELLGTVIEIKLPQQHSSLFSSCFEELERIEKTYSRFLDNSVLSKLNTKLNEWQPISDELIYLIESALEFNRKTQGNFDVTLKSKLDELGYDKNYTFERKETVQQNDNATLKSPLLKNTIEKIKNKIQVQKPIELERKNSKLLLRKEIEFGGFGKGFALDKVADILDSEDIDHYYINAGGDVFAKRGQNEEPWTILLEHPDDTSRAIGTMELDARALACSAPNRRKWKEYHHLLNAQSGMPSIGVKAIYLVAKLGIQADAYATGIFTAGFEQGIELSKQLPVEMLMVSSENKMYQSPGFKAELYY